MRLLEIGGALNTGDFVKSATAWVLKLVRLAVIVSLRQWVELFTGSQALTIFKFGIVEAAKLVDRNTVN